MRFSPQMAVAATVVVAALGYFGLAWITPAQTIESVALTLLEQPNQVDFASSDPGAVRSWLLEETGLDVPIPARQSGLVQIVGASALPSRLAGGRLARVAYRVDGQEASLVVAAAPNAERSYPVHQIAQHDSQQRVTSWTLGGQNYAVAWPAAGAMEATCLLCHASSEPPLLN